MRSMLRRIADRLRGGGAARQLARGTIISFFIQATGVALILLAEIVLARTLGAEDYGLFATVMAWMQVLAVIALLGSNHLLLRLVPAYVSSDQWPLLRGVMRYCSRNSVFFGLAIYLLVLLFLMIFRGHIDPSTLWAFIIGIAVVPVSALSQQRQAILRGLHRVIEALSPELIMRPLMLVLLVLCLAWVTDMQVPAMAALAMNGVAMIAIFMVGRHWQWKAMPPMVRSAVPASDRAAWLNASIPLFLITVLQLIIVRMDIILLGALSGHDQAGYYAAASRVADLIVFALASANVIVAPLIAGLHTRGDMAGMQYMLALLAKGVTILTLPVVAVIGLLGEDILGYFGSDYTIAYVPLLILVCGQVVNALTGPVDFVMSMTGQQMKMLQILTAAMALNLVLNLLLIPPLGLAGAAIATASTTVFWNLYMRRVVRQRLGIDPSVLVLLRKRG